MAINNLLLKLVDMQAYIDLTLDNESIVTECFESVKYIFELYSSRTNNEIKNLFFNTLERLPFISKLISNSEVIELHSMLETIHDNYRYHSENKDFWLNINDELQEGNQLSLLSEGVPEHEK